MNLEQSVNLTIVIVYILTITVVGLWYGRKENKSAKGYFLGGKKFTWWMIGASIFATNISSMQLTAQSGEAYRIGLAAANPQMTGGLMLGISAAFFIPIYLRTGIYTIPRFLEMRFSHSCKIFNSIAVVFKGFLAAPIGIFAGSLAIIKVFNLGEENLWIIALLMGGTVGLYAVIGGLSSVVITDVIQITILVVGGIVVLVAGLAAIPDLGVFWANMKESQHLEMILPADHPSNFRWTSVVTGMALGSLIWTTSEPGLLQRVLGAKDLHNAQMGMVLGAFLKISAVFIIVFPGVIAAQLFPGENPEGVYAVMVREILPIGLSGLVLAALLAALMSTQDSGVCMISSIVALELYPAVDKKSNEKKALKVGKITATVMLVFGVACAPLIANLDSVYTYVMKMSTYMTTPIGICYLGGRFIKRVNHVGALSTMIVGIPLALYSIIVTTVDSLNFMAPEFILTQPFFVVAFVYSIFYAIILIGVSLLTNPPPPDKTDFMDKAMREIEDEIVPWYKSFRFWIGLFLICFMAIYFVF